MTPQRLCPLCALRAAAVISPTCPVCHGTGTIPLTARSADEYGAETVSTAVHLALEVQARELDRNPHHRSIDPAPALTDTLHQLTIAGLIHDPKAPSDPPRSQPTPTALAATATGRAPDRTDQLMIRAHPYPYRFNDRPGARGLPILSANFHPSSLARQGDPAPFDTTTIQAVTAREKRHRAARYLVQYATHRDQAPRRA